MCEDSQVDSSTLCVEQNGRLHWHPWRYPNQRGSKPSHQAGGTLTGWLSKTIIDETAYSPFAQSISTILNFKQPMCSFSETNPKFAFWRAQMRRFSFTNWSAKPIDL